MMNAINIIPSWFWFIVGLFLGLGIHYYISITRKDGIIHVTPGNEEKPDTYLFEFNIPPEDIPELRQVVFKVLIQRSNES